MLVYGSKININYAQSTLDLSSSSSVKNIKCGFFSSPSFFLLFLHIYLTNKPNNRRPVQLLQQRNTPFHLTLIACILYITSKPLFHISIPVHTPTIVLPSSLEKGDTHSTFCTINIHTPHLSSHPFLLPYVPPFLISILAQQATNKHTPTLLSSFSHIFIPLSYKRCRSMYQATTSISQSTAMPIQTNYNSPPHNIVSSKNNVTTSPMLLPHKSTPKKEDPI